MLRSLLNNVIIADYHCNGCSATISEYHCNGLALTISLPRLQQGVFGVHVGVREPGADVRRGLPAQDAARQGMDSFVEFRMILSNLHSFETNI